MSVLVHVAVFFVVILSNIVTHTVLWRSRRRLLRQDYLGADTSNAVTSPAAGRFGHVPRRVAMALTIIVTRPEYYPRVGTFLTASRCESVSLRVRKSFLAVTPPQIVRFTSRACSTAHRSNRPDHWDGLVLDRSAVGQFSSLSSRTKWQRLPAGDTLRRVSPAGNRCHFVLLDNLDESCPTADLSNTRSSQWFGLFDRWAVEHAPNNVPVPGRDPSLCRALQIFLLLTDSQTQTCETIATYVLPNGTVIQWLGWLWQITSLYSYAY